jgi:hypothetical protein
VCWGGGVWFFGGGGGGVFFFSSCFSCGCGFVRALIEVEMKTKRNASIAPTKTFETSFKDFITTSNGVPNGNSRFAISGRLYAFENTFGDDCHGVR